MKALEWLALLGSCALIWAMTAYAIREIADGRLF
jgi:hypothetical protein